MLRTDGNFHTALDRKLTKYLTHLISGTYSVADVQSELRSIIIMAMRGDARVFMMVGEGDPVLGDDQASLDGFEDDGTIELIPTH